MCHTTRQVLLLEKVAANDDCQEEGSEKSIQGTAQTVAAAIDAGGQIRPQEVLLTGTAIAT